MATSDTASLPTGAYIIRNRLSSTVLQTPTVDAAQGKIIVQAQPQDEAQLDPQNIWWVEPVAEKSTDPSKGPIYSITHPNSGTALEASAERGWVFANKYSDSPSQKWILHKATDARTREVTYTIVSVWNGNVLDIHNTGWQSTSQSSAGAIVRPFHPGIILYPWEFTLPSVHVPLGWLHIQNVATGHLLCQSRRGYGWADLVPAPDLLPEPQYRATWQFQWTLCQSRWFDESTAREHNSWRIINRETRYPLCVFHNGTHPEWTLQLDTPRSWRIVSCASQGLVTDSQADGGLCCSPHVLPPSSGRQSWLLKTLGPSFANSPPRYEPVHHRTPPPEASLHLPASRKLTTNYSPCRKIAMQNSAVPTVRLSLMLRFTLGLMRGRGRFRT